MLKMKDWIGVVTAPILLASAGCAISHRANPTVQRGLPPERLMMMAQTFERQGHLPQAKCAYMQVLAVQPGYASAQQSLDLLIAKEMRQNQLKFGHPTNQPTQMLAQSQQLNGNKVGGTTAASPTVPTLSTPSSTSVESSITETIAIPTSSTTATIPSVSTESANSTTPSTSTIKIQTVATVTTPTVPVSDLAVDLPAPAAPEGVQPPILQQAPGVYQPPYVQLTPVLPQTSAAFQVTVVGEPTALDDVPAPTTESVDQNVTVEQNTTALQEPVFLQPLIQQPSNVAESKPVATQLLDVPPAPSSESPVEQENASISSLPPAVESATVSVSSDEWLNDADKNIKGQKANTSLEEPTINLSQIANAELQAFFKPFHVGMVQYLKDNRERFQSQLVAIATDNGSSKDVRTRAVFLLGAIGPDASDAVPALRRTMHKDPDLYLRVDLSDAILKIQPEDEDAIRVLVDCLKNSDQNLRWMAAFALRNAVSPRTTFIIDNLKALLKTDDLRLTRMVFLTLAEFGPAASAVIPDLEAALDSPDAATREVAKASLACIAPNRKTASMIRATSHHVETKLTK